MTFLVLVEVGTVKVWLWIAYKRVDVEESECLVGIEKLHGGDISCLKVS